MADPLARALSRTCQLSDFAGVRTPAAWQERLVGEVIGRWRAEQPAFPAQTAPLAIVNWSGCSFVAPGPTAVYWSELPLLTAPYLGALIALSVLDRIDAPLRFLTQARDRLLPGGLLIACFAFWDADGPDCATGRELRRRLYNRKTLERLIYDLLKADLPTWGRVDWRYGGDCLGDHTIASLVVRKTGADQ